MAQPAIFLRWLSVKHNQNVDYRQAEVKINLKLDRLGPRIRIPKDNRNAKNPVGDRENRMVPAAGIAMEVAERRNEI